MNKRCKSSKKSLSHVEDHWLACVTKAYGELVRQWSAFSTMISSCPQPGWQVSLEPLSVPKLSVSRVLPSRQTTYVWSGTSSGTSGGTGYYLSNLPTATVQGIYPAQAPSVPPRPQKPVPTKAKSRTLKPATCRTARKRSGR
mgnify:CR=1 FL=1